MYANSLAQNYEPALVDVFSDPIIQMLMRYDGVTEEDVLPYRHMVAQHETHEELA